MLALGIISQWSMVERDFATFLVSIAPGKAMSIAELLNAARADSPKRALRNAFALSHLIDDERPIFDWIQAKYETCYKLRNPLAHWTLASCKQFPGVLVAINPEDYLRITAEGESEVDLLVREMAAMKIPSPSELNISEATMAKLGPMYVKHTNAAMAYREKDLSSTHEQITKLLSAIRLFRMIVRFRCLDLDRDKRAVLLRRQYSQLGLGSSEAR
jgi:hypothetical protein